MNRLIAAFSILVLAVALSFGPQSGGALVTTAKAGGTKLCKAKTAEGKTKTWRCGTDQACCVNQMMGLYVCGYPGLGCL